MKLSCAFTGLLLASPFLVSAQLWEWAIRPAYDSVVTHPNVSFVQDHGRWGLVDWEGHVLAEPQFEALDYLSPDFVKFKKGAQWGIFSLGSGRVYAEAQYDTVSLAPPLTSEWPAFQPQPYAMKQLANLRPEQRNKALSSPERFPRQYTLEPLAQHAFKTPVVDNRTGEVLYVQDNPVSLYYAGDNGRSVRLLNAFGQEVHKGPLAAVGAFTNELLLVRQTPDGPFGLLHARSGALVSGFVYDSVVVNSPSTFYLYQRGGKWGLLSPDGREVEPPRYDFAHPYNYCVWLKHRDYALLMNRRNEVFDFDGPYQNVLLQPNERGAWVLQNGNWGLVKFWW